MRESKAKCINKCYKRILNDSFPKQKSLFFIDSNKSTCINNICKRIPKATYKRNRKIFSRKIKRAENVVCFVFALDSAFEFRAKYLNQVLNLPIDIDYILILSDRYEFYFDSIGIFVNPLKLLRFPYSNQ